MTLPKKWKGFGRNESGFFRGDKEERSPPREHRWSNRLIPSVTKRSKYSKARQELITKFPPPLLIYLGRRWCLDQKGALSASSMGRNSLRQKEKERMANSASPSPFLHFPSFSSSSSSSSVPCARPHHSHSLKKRLGRSAAVLQKQCC